MLPLELLYRDVDSLEVSNFKKEFIKCRLRDSAFSSYKDTGKTIEKNLPKLEFDALKILLKKQDIIQGDPKKVSLMKTSIKSLISDQLP